MAALSPPDARVPVVLEPFGRDLHRPECVLTTPAGDVYVSDARGGVTAIRTDSRQQSWLAKPAGRDVARTGLP